MKRVAVVVVAVIATLFLASATQSVAGQSMYSRGGDGLLRMKHSPTLGINIPIAVWIDGMQAGAFARGHVYQRALTPGRHTVYASRPTNMSDSWYGTLDVQPGETYSFIVKCTVNQVYLIPVAHID